MSLLHIMVWADMNVNTTEAIIIVVSKGICLAKYKMLPDITSQGFVGRLPAGVQREGSQFKFKFFSAC